MNTTGQYKTSGPDSKPFAVGPMFVALLVFGSALIGLAGYLSMDRYAARKPAIQVEATVVEIETKSQVSARDHQGHPTEYQDRQQVRISFHLDGEVRHGTLLNTHFDPESSWLQYADFDRENYPAGSKIEVLVRPDLGYGATNASVLASYFLPILIASFGGLIFLIAEVPLLLSLLRRKSGSSN